MRVGEGFLERRIRAGLGRCFPYTLLSAAQSHTQTQQNPTPPNNTHHFHQTQQKQIKTPTVGSYCEGGSLRGAPAKPCPSGTTTAAKGAQAESDCSECATNYARPQSGGDCKLINDQACTEGAECVSGVCSESQQCVANACLDGRKGQDEADVDCGGTCILVDPPQTCSVDKACTESQDCASSICYESKCVSDCPAGQNGATCADCTDGNAELSVDGCVCKQGYVASTSGGPCKLAVEQTCTAPGDCNSGICSVVDGNKCKASCPPGYAGEACDGCDTGYVSSSDGP